MQTTNNRPPTQILRPTLVVSSMKGAAFLYFPRADSLTGSPLKIRLAPRLARLLIVLDAARRDDEHVIEDLRGFRSASVLRAEIEKLQGTLIEADSTGAFEVIKPGGSGLRCPN